MSMRTGVVIAFVVLFPVLAATTQPQSGCLTDAQEQTLGSLRALARAVQAYATDEQQFPKASSIDELSAILEPDYMRTCPRKDAWGNELLYRVSADRQHFRVASPGADGLFEQNSKIIGADVNAQVPCKEPNSDLIWEDDGFVQVPSPKPIH